MDHIDRSPLDKLADTLKGLGFEAEAFWAEIGETHALAQGPFIRLRNRSPQPEYTHDALQPMLLAFYKEQGFIDLDRQIILRRIGQFGDLLVASQITEFLDMLDSRSGAVHLAKISSEFGRWDNYLSRAR